MTAAHNEANHHDNHHKKKKERICSGSSSEGSRLAKASAIILKVCTGWFWRRERVRVGII